MNNSGPGRHRRQRVVGTALTALGLVVFLPLTPLFLVYTTGKAIVQDLDQRKQAGSPPVLGPGHCMSDYRRQLITHPIQRHRKRSLLQSGMEDSILPFELCELVIDFCQEDLQSLLACSLVCSAWTPRARSHIFCHIHVSKRRAYTLVKLLRSPYCSQTIVPSIRAVKLDGDDQFWHTVSPLLLELVKLGIRPETLDVTLFAGPGTINRRRLGELGTVHLKLTCEAWRLTPVSAFYKYVSSFQHLETLEVQFRVTMPAPDPVMAIQALTGAKTFQLSTKLRNLSIKFSNTSIGWAATRLDVLGWFLAQHAPNLTSFHLICPEATSTLKEIELVRGFLQRHTGITELGFGVWLIAESVARGLGSGIPQMIKEHRASIFSRLRSLHIECTSTYKRPSQRLKKLMPQIAHLVQKLKMPRASSRESDSHRRHSCSNTRDRWALLTEISVGVRHAGLLDCTRENLTTNFMFLDQVPFKLVTGSEEDFSSIFRYRRETGAPG